MDRHLSSIRFLQISNPTGDTAPLSVQPGWVDQLRRELLIKVSYRIVKREEEMKAESLWGRAQ